MPESTVLPSGGLSVLIVLGPAGLCGPGGPGSPPLLAPSKPLALVVYLHCQPGRTATRDHLIDLLWADVDPDRARHSLRQTIYALKRALGEGGIEGERDQVSLRAEFECDRDRFLAAVEAADPEATIARYSGPFFPTFASPGGAEFERWADGERERLRGYYLRAAERCCKRALGAGRVKDAQRIARRARDEHPLAESGWRLLLEALVAGRDRGQALVEIEALRRMLADAERAPEPQTTALVRFVTEGTVEEPGAHEPAGLIAELVGREREFVQLVAAWHTVRHRSGHHVHLTAAAGIGKTRLLGDFAARLRADGVRVVHLRPSAGERDIPYVAAGDLALQLGRFRGAAGVSQEVARILVPLAPALSEIFSLSTRLTVTGHELLRQRRAAMLEVVAAVVHEGPVAILVDDAHWLDRQSWKILEAMRDALPDHHALLVTASRPMTDRTFEGPSSRKVALEPLSLSGTSELIASLGAPPGAEWLEQVAGALHRATGGSPLLLLETIRNALDSGLLTLSESGWQSPDFPALVARLASEVAIHHRITTLSRESRWLLVLLAVAAAPVAETDLLEMAELGGGRVAALEELERRGFITRMGDLLEASHDEIAAAALDVGGIEAVRKAHGQVGRLLARRHPESLSALGRAVRHLMEGDADRDARPVWLQLVRTVRRSGDPRPAYELARELMGAEAASGRVKALVSSLPMGFRLGRAGFAAVVAFVLLGSAAGFLAWRSFSVSRILPDAILLLAVGDPGSGEVMLRRIGITRADWDPLDTLTSTSGTRVGRLTEVRGLFGWLAPSPDGLRVAYDRIVEDSGQIDIFLREQDGSVLRLTHERGDDLEPSWAPDGSAFAFSTARWTPADDHDSDIGVYDLASGKVRQLTAGQDTDKEPRWSPDGTRIAFRRHSATDGGRRLCWVTADGSRERCLENRSQDILLVVGWRSGDQVVVAERSSGGNSRLTVLDIEAGTSLSIDSLSRVAGAHLSTDGRWVICTCARARDDSVDLVVFPLDQPNRKRLIRGGSMPTPWSAGWSVNAETSPGGITAVTIDSSGPLVGLPHHMRVRAADSEGRTVPLSSSVLRWTSGPEPVAAIDSLSGVVLARGTGDAWIRVSAGGWRQDSVFLNVRRPRWVLVTRERWEEDWGSRWIAYGDPLPQVAVGPGGGRGFHNNGDQAFDSGAYSEASFDARNGLGIQFEFVAPITRPKWQRIHAAVIAGPRIHPGGAQGETSCGWRLPKEEGLQGLRSMSMGIPGEDIILMPGRELTSGAWHRARLQLFPDGTCGLALDGRPVWRSALGIPLTSPFHVNLAGASVRTKILVGPVEVWTGVRDDVDWSALRR